MLNYPALRVREGAIGAASSTKWRSRAMGLLTELSRHVPAGRRDVNRVRPRLSSGTTAHRSPRSRRWHTGKAHRLLNGHFLVLAFDRLEVALAHPAGRCNWPGSGCSADPAVPYRKCQVDPACDLGDAVQRDADEGSGLHDIPFALEHKGISRNPADPENLIKYS